MRDPGHYYRPADADICKNFNEYFSRISAFRMPGGFHPPPSVIQSWPEPNYVDPEAKGKELLVISLVLTVLAIVFVGARLLVRWRIQKQLGWDDGLLALSLVCSLIF